MTKQTKVTLIVGSVVAALLVAAIIVGVMILNTMRAEAENDAYQDCMARHGFAADGPPPSVAEGDEDDYLDAIVAAAAECSKP